MRPSWVLQAQAAFPQACPLASAHTPLGAQSQASVEAKEEGANAEPVLPSRGPGNHTRGPKRHSATVLEGSHLRHRPGLTARRPCACPGSRGLGWRAVADGLGWASPRPPLTRPPLGLPLASASTQPLLGLPSASAHLASAHSASARPPFDLHSLGLRSIVPAVRGPTAHQLRAGVARRPVRLMKAGLRSRPAPGVA